jgi:hypothetical protein
MWYGISGSCRTTNRDVENDVRCAVREIIHSGNGIVSGGTLGVDFFATDEALKLDVFADQLKIILPTPKSIFFSHYRRAAKDGKITILQAENLISQLTEVDNRGALTAMSYSLCNPETYYLRNGEVINSSDALLAFRVNESEGTQDAINKALARGLPVTIKEYTI